MTEKLISKQKLEKIVHKNKLANEPKSSDILYNEISHKLKQAICDSINKETIIKALNSYMQIQQDMDFTINAEHIVILIFDEYKIDQLQNHKPKTLLNPHPEKDVYISFDRGSFVSLLDHIIDTYPKIDQNTIKHIPYFEENVLDNIVDSLDYSEYEDNNEEKQKYYDKVMNKATGLIQDILKQGGYTNKVIKRY